MDNQHKQITGYRDFDSQETIDFINKVKQHAELTQALLDELKKHPSLQVDPRWLAEGTTDLQKGFMSVVRSIAKPTTF